MERKYKAFISYRHAELDSAVAKTLHTLIEQYRIPKALRTNGEKKMGIVFRDEEELSATNDLTDKIYTALDNSEHLVVICTKATLQSPWVTKEVEHFLKNHERDKAHIILADGEPMEVFPRPLTHHELENGMIEVTEPMAVDVRAEDIPAVKKRIKSQILRLFAAMLGCPYDALAMREQHRKRQRFAAIMSVILAIAIGFSTVLLVKNHQIDRKNAELDSANTALEAKNEELDKKNSELDQKNEELEEKNSEVLMRESELLTSNSEEAYKEGDNYTAISSASTALPTENDPRPYYAPAEAALLTALSPFDGEDGYIMRDTVLEQSTPVENFRIS
ncbi:MAG: TIR domain-containing protein, partial [Oscillospiraceae bacterium]|nr:TIR domain-containing protein [Oscillospiraceae bacterium]